MDWKEKLKNTDAAEYLDKLILDIVEVDEKSSRVQIRFQCEEPQMPVVAYSIQKQFNQVFAGQGEIHVQLCSTASAERFFSSVETFSPFLTSLVMHYQPGMRPFSDYLKYYIQKNVLNVCLPTTGSVSLWENAQLDVKLQTYLSGLFQIDLKVFHQLEESEMEFRVNKTMPIQQKSVSSPSKIAHERKRENNGKGKQPVIFGSPNKTGSCIPISEVDEQCGRAKIEGRVCKVDIKETRDGSRIIFLFNVTDDQDTITCKILLERKKTETKRVLEQIKVGASVQVQGFPYADKYSSYECVIDAKCVTAISSEQRMDLSDEKRVELHLHTQMSTLDSTLGIKEAVQTAAKWGHKAMAVTDHGVVQAFPEFYDAAKKAGIKAIFGMEGYLHDDCTAIPLQEYTYVVFDLETTGVSHKTDQLTEIGAVKMRNGKILDRFDTFVNPCVLIPQEVVKLTGITNEMVKDAPMPDIALKMFKDFCGEDAILVAHNATSFDVRFIVEHGARYGIEFNNYHIDTLPLARYLLRDLERHRLNDLTEHFQISLENHHRADCDAEATAYVLMNLLDLWQGMGLNELPVVTAKHRAKTSKENQKNYHILFLVKDEVGLKNLYQLVSFSHLQHFRRRPRIPRSLLMQHREGLIVGSACEAGELFQAVLTGEGEEELVNIASYYDFLEIQPIGNNEFLIREGRVKEEEELRKFNRTIVALAEKLGKPCVATGDVHFLNPSDEKFRRILLDSLQFDDADKQPPLFFKTTEEMLQEFSYLGDEKAREVVIETPNAIAEQCKMMRPFPAETCQPTIEGAEEELVNCCLEQARRIYGDPLPEIVKERLERELNSITTYKFSSLYVTARRLVLKSNEDGYLVGSRGSVGSSLVAFLSGITEVNSLQAHYVCPECKHSEFDIDPKYVCGCDLPDKLCPICNALYNKDGYNIPFETFLGFEGDKVPDIDLNFSGEYQPVAHKYTEVLFGKGHVFRAGTISGVQEKTAFGYVIKYMEKRNQTARKAEMERLAQGCCGVKRTTGQHPGGIVVVPENRSVYEFTPLQHPADKYAAGSVTTHFDFNSMHDTLVKLDILGHDDPTMIRMLQDLTKIDPKTIPMDDPETMKIFSSTDVLGVSAKDLGSEVATYGVPEFGTSFVRRMLVETRPTTMEELVRVSGLSHGTDVWTNNAQDMIKAGTVTLSEAICTRDDIMTYLIRCGMDKKESFTIMESVRKGKGLTENMEASMKASGVPEWYIDSCKKIKYMFPRAHAAAYVMMAYRIAYCKVHYPAAYYATYFTVRADAFDIAEASLDITAIKRRIKEIESMGLKATEKDKSTQTILEVVLEMKLRGIDFQAVDLMQSDAKKFRILDDSKILPPLNAIAGLGNKAAESIVEARVLDGKLQPFRTHEDLQRRAKVGKACTDTLAQAGCLDGIMESDQLSLFAALDM